MSPEPLDRHIEVAHRRFEALKAQAGESGVQAPLTLETLEELSSALEELHVANEELRQQNDQLAASRQLVEAEQHRYQELFELAPDGYLVTDPEGVIREANRAAAEMLGVQQDFLVGKPLLTFIARPDHKTFHDYLTQFHLMPVSMQRVLDRQFRLQPRRGAPIMTALTIGLSHNADGLLTGLRWLVRDIGEKIRADEELKRSREELRRLAAYLVAVREEERARIARELHDELGQGLIALKMDLWQLTKRPLPDQPIPERVDEMLTLVDGMIGSTRRILTNLRPSILDDLGLAAAIEWQAQEFEARTGIECRLASTPVDINLDPQTSTALFRICQEALTNAARHAQATSITISLGTKANGHLVLTIEDNGRGITEGENSRPGSMGLSSMHERALMLGGTLSIVGRPVGGTTVTVTIPPAPQTP